MTERAFWIGPEPPPDDPWWDEVDEQTGLTNREFFAEGGPLEQAIRAAYGAPLDEPIELQVGNVKTVTTFKVIADGRPQKPE